MLLSPQSRTWAEIDADALAHNFANLSTLYTDTYGARVMAIVKADAYGHGLEIIVRQCHSLGVQDYGVATVEEGVAARRIAGPEANIYLLSPVTPQEAMPIVAHQLITVVSSHLMAAALSQTAASMGLTAEIHLDIDTGMGRSGFTTEEARAAFAAMHRLPNVRVTGVATHFASADEDPDDARAQLALFQSALESLGAGARGLTVHTSNSPASMLLGAAGAYQLVRPGLLLYGIEPAPGAWAQSPCQWRPVLSLKTRVTLVHRLRAGDTVSYGKTYTVPSGRRHVRDACDWLRGRLFPPLHRRRICPAPWAPRADLRASLHGSDGGGCLGNPRSPGRRHRDDCRDGRRRNARRRRDGRRDRRDAARDHDLPDRARGARAAFEVTVAAVLR